MNNRFFGHTQPQTWRDLLKELKAAKDELRRHENIMTPYERQAISESIKARAEAVAPRLLGGAIAEWKAAIEVYQDKAAAVEKARIAEINRWDNGRLGAEIGAVKTLVELALSGLSSNALAGGTGKASPRLERIYNEAQASGDIYKQRAAAEVFRSLDGASLKTDTTDRAAVSGLARKADKDLPALRVTDGIMQAIQERDAAAEAVYSLRSELNDVSLVMGYGDATGLFASGPIASAFRGVKFNNDHTLTIFPEDSVEVTGIQFKDPEDAQRSFIVGGEVENE